MSALNRIQRGFGVLGLRLATNQQRWSSVSTSAPEWLTVREDSKTGFATLEMKKGPVNSLNLDFLTQLHIAIEKLGNERDCKGMILTSGVPNIFCAGLDILEMYQCQAERASEFWRSLQTLWLTLYGSRLITFAGINGHSPAGGCLLATACDHRAMISTHNYTIGLNEAQLGIIAPFWFKDSMQNTVGHRVTERSIQLGTLYPAHQALHIGLIDHMCETEDELHQHLEEQIKLWTRIPEAARILSKQMMRRETMEKLERRREDDIKHFVGFVMKESVQAQLGAYLEGLKKK